ncbi:MAG: TetR/AcrR family transcriptional regulator [Pseudomonas sp.]
MTQPMHPSYIMPFNPYLAAPPTGKSAAACEAILQAASEVFAEQGFAAAKVQSIATRAGLPKANVLYHFKSKDNLYSQVLARVTGPYLEACRAFEPQEQPLEALTRHIRALSRLFQEQPFGAKVLMTELAAGATRLSAEHVERWRTQARQSVARLGEWIDLGLLAPADPQHVLMQLWAMAQACINLGWQMPRVIGKPSLQASDHAAFEGTVQLLLRGLLVTQANPLASLLQRQA